MVLTSVCVRARRYVLRLLGWARKYGLRVELDLHTIPGSQNGTCMGVSPLSLSSFILSISSVPSPCPLFRPSPSSLPP